MMSACGVCGKVNRKNAKFCANCAARLGVEPIDPSLFDAAPAAPDTRHSPDFDAQRTAYSHPMSLRAALMSREPAIFWVRAGMAGLVLLIGFVAWCLYVLTANKGIPKLPVSESTVLAAPQPTTGPPPAAAAPDAERPALSPSSRVATSELRAATVPSRRTPPAGAESAPKTAAAAVPRIADAPRTRPAATPRADARERVRRPVPTDADGAPPNTAWVEPSRPNARTSMPTYEDPGPPIVPGPGPRYASPPPSPAVAPREFAGPAQGGDLGPPIAPGPGPRYDFSSPGATPR